MGGLEIFNKTSKSDKLNQRKPVQMAFIDDSYLMCGCGSAPQRMMHLVSCPACPDTCNREELMDDTNSAVLVTSGLYCLECHRLFKKKKKK